MTKRGLSYYELYKNRFNSSEELLQQALSIAQKNYFLNEEQECLASLAEVYMAQNDYPKYHYFAQKHDSVSNLIVNEKILRATQDLELKYETEKKQSQILLLEQDKKLRNVSIIGLLIIMLLLSVKGFFFTRNLNRKRQLVEKDAELKAQRISELETERQLTATQALLQGEEAERKRLARDLHDGLGGMLSVIKLNLTNMKGNAILPETDIPAFENALEMLDGSIRELRRVAHNLMPESLMRYGLKAALSDFCGSIDLVKFHYFGNDQRMDERYEVAVFRIAQELVNNAIKHSKSRQINVQVIQEQERINLVVQDNGIGFNPDKLKDMNTSGLSSIRSRVESLKGQLDFFSEPQKGTEVQVNFNF
jgi:signal transduction histidine kinase